MKAFFPHFFLICVEKLFVKGFSSEAHLIEIHFISQLVFFQSKHSNFFKKYTFLLFSYKILSIETKQVQFKLDLCELVFVLLLLHFVGFQVGIFALVALRAHLLFALFPPKIIFEENNLEVDYIGRKLFHLSRKLMFLGFHIKYIKII